MDAIVFVHNPWIAPRKVDSVGQALLCEWFRYADKMYFNAGISAEFELCVKICVNTLSVKLAASYWRNFIVFQYI